MKKIYFLALLLAASFATAPAQSPTTQGPTKIKGTLDVSGDVTLHTKITSPQFCIANSCITVWPTGTGTATYPGVAGVPFFDGTGWGTSFNTSGSGAIALTNNAFMTNLHASMAGDPSASLDVATKHYVDTALTSIASLPGSETRFLAAATCNGGVAFSSSFSTYDNQQPQLGCVNPSTSSAAYLNFQAGATTPQYATTTITPPPYWQGSDVTLYFSTTATTGNVSWIVESGCTNAGDVLGAVTYGTPVTVTTNAATGMIVSAQQTNIFVPGVNGCVAGSSTASGSVLTFRVHRSASDTAAADAQFLGATLTSRRSQ